MKRLTATLYLTIAVLLGSVGAAQAFDELSLKKLMVLISCIGCDLSGVNLALANLSGAVLSYANIQGAKVCATKTPWGLDNSCC